MRDLARDVSANGETTPSRDTPGYPPGEDSQNGADQTEARDGSLIGELALSHPDLALSGVIRRVPGVTVRPTRVTASTGSRLMVFTARGERLEPFETALDDSTTVSDPLVIERTTNGRVFRVELTDDTRWITPDLVQAGARPLNVESCHGKWEVRGQFRSRAALGAFREYCENNDISFTLKQLYWTSRADHRTDFGLSPNQLETVREAHRSGYFDVPRQVSQQELADHFGISSSAVSQRLRRATAQILEETVLPDDTAGSNQ